MSVRKVTMYRVVCDWPGCDACAQDGGDYFAWSDPERATDDADYGGADWPRSPDGTFHYCTKHPAEWASDHEHGEPYPDPPYLLIHHGDTGNPGDDGHVTLIATTTERNP